MKRSLIIFVTVLSVTLISSSRLCAQEKPEPSEDQKIEALRKRQQELKRQIREELEKQNKALEEELNALRRSDPVKEKPAASGTNQMESADGETPQTKTAGTGEANGASLSAQPASAPVRPAALATNPAQPVNSATTNPTAAASSASAAQPASQGTSCALVLATPNQYSRAEQSMCFLARAIVNRRIAFNGGDTSQVTTIDPNAEDLTFLTTIVLGQLIQGNLVVDEAIKSFVVDVEAQRTDKQLGADPKASGTTSLGVKGGIPQVLSWGVENGAAVASRDGTTLTFRVNPVGFVQALSGQGYIAGFDKIQNDPIAKFFNRTSVGFSFDTTRGTNPPTLIGSKQQLSAVSFRYNLVNQRDPRDQRYKALWDKFFSEEGLAFTDTQTKQFMKIQQGNVAGTFKDANLQQWVNTANTALGNTSIKATALNKNAAIDEVRSVLAQKLQVLPVSELLKDTELTDALTKLVGAYGPYLKKKKEIMDEVAKGTLVTFEYTNYREPNAPDLSNLRFIAERGTLGGVDFTANASLTFFNKRPVGPSVQRIRDFDLSAQLDKRLDDVMGLGAATLSFTGKFQRLTSNAVAFDGTVLPNTKGDIAAGQVKLTIPIKDSGIKVPISFTFANRTELVREKETRGNFGFTFDLDTLFARFRSFTRP